MNEFLLIRNSPLDWISLIWFLSWWIGYSLFADWKAKRSQALMTSMHAYRLQWMQRMQERENRMVDSFILGNLLRGVSFFASTTIIILAGLMAVLGATEKAVSVIAEIPFTVDTPLIVWEAKLLLLIAIFVHAFFKFTWALRQFNYCGVLIGAAPMHTDAPATREAFATRTANISSMASKNFNQGLRAYYFALAVLTWFVHPVLFMATTTWTVGILYWREFRSAMLAALGSPPPR